MRTLASKIIGMITWVMIIIQNYDPNSELVFANSTTNSGDFPPSGDAIILFAIIEEEVVLMTYNFNIYSAPVSSFDPTTNRVVMPATSKKIQEVYPRVARLFSEDLNWKHLDRGYAFFTRSWDGKHFLTYINDYDPPASQDFGFDPPNYEISTTHMIANDIFEQNYTFVSTDHSYLYEIGFNGTKISKMQYAYHDSMTVYRILEGNMSICSTDQSNIQILKGDCQALNSLPIKWNLGKAGLLYQNRIYLIGKDVVYIFSEQALTNRPTLYPLEKVPLKQFFVADPGFNVSSNVSCTNNGSCSDGELNTIDDFDSEFNVWWMLILILVPVWLIVACYFCYYKQFRSVQARAEHQEGAGQ